MTEILFLIKVKFIFCIQSCNKDVKKHIVYFNSFSVVKVTNENLLSTNFQSIEMKMLFFKYFLFPVHIF